MSTKNLYSRKNFFFCFSNPKKSPVYFKNLNKFLQFCQLIHFFCRYYCIKFVYQLNSRVDSLTVTLVVTLRKFLSLIVSIVWFKNPFTGKNRENLPRKKEEILKISTKKIFFWLKITKIQNFSDFSHVFFSRFFK